MSVAPGGMRSSRRHENFVNEDGDRFEIIAGPATDLSSGIIAKVNNRDLFSNRTQAFTGQAKLIYQF